MFFFVFFNFKRGFFSWTFWFGASFICKNAHLCLHSGFTWWSWAKYIKYLKAQTIPHICHFFTLTHYFLQKILHSKVREFTTKIYIYYYQKSTASGANNGASHFGFAQKPSSLGIAKFPWKKASQSLQIPIMPLLSLLWWHKKQSDANRKENSGKPRLSSCSDTCGRGGSTQRYDWVQLVPFSLPSWLRSVHVVLHKYKMRGNSIWNI